MLKIQTNRVQNVKCYTFYLLGSYNPVSVPHSLFKPPNLKAEGQPCCPTLTLFTPSTNLVQTHKQILQLYLKCSFYYKIVGTLGFHPEALPTSELHLGPPQHTQEEFGRSSPISVSPKSTGPNTFGCNN